MPTNKNCKQSVLCSARKKYTRLNNVAPRSESGQLVAKWTCGLANLYKKAPRPILEAKHRSRRPELRLAVFVAHSPLRCLWQKVSTAVVSFGSYAKKALTVWSPFQLIHKSTASQVHHNLLLSRSSRVHCTRSRGKREPCQRGVGPEWDTEINKFASVWSGSSGKWLSTSDSDTVTFCHIDTLTRSGVDMLRTLPKRSLADGRGAKTFKLLYFVWSPPWHIS